MAQNEIAPAKFYRLADLERIFSCKKSLIYSRMADGTFPRPVKFGRCSLWPVEQIEQFAEKLTARS